MLSLTLATLFFILLAGNAVAQTIPVKPDPPKAGGATRIGLVTPRVSLLGGGGSVQQETVQLSKNISSFLTGPRMGTVELRAKLDSLAEEEGKERGCDYVLYVSLIRKRPPAARGSGASFGGGGTKAGDEFTFEYKVVPTDGSAAPAGKTIKATVSADGEDVLTSMIEAMAQVVVALAKARPPTTASSSPSPEINTEPAVTPQPSSTPAKTPAERPKTGYGSLTADPKGATPARGTDPPKAEGTIRIGIATPRVTYIGGGMSGNSDAASLRETLASYLVGSNIETIDLKARLEPLTLNEAQKRECDLVLYTTLQRKRSASSNRGEGLDSIMGTVGGGGVGSKIPGAKTTQQIGSGAAKVSGAIAALARANDEITFEFRLVTSVGARQIAGNNTKAKVKKDGEDVLTPMIESAAQAIVDATVRK